MKKLAIFAAIIFAATSALNAGDIRVRHWDVTGGANGLSTDMTWSDGADISDNFSAAWGWSMGWDDNGGNGTGHADMEHAYVGWNNSWGSWHTGIMPCGMIGNSMVCDGNGYNMGMRSTLSSDPVLLESDIAVGTFNGHHISLNDLGGWALNIWEDQNSGASGMSTDLSDMVGWGMTIGTSNSGAAGASDSMWISASMDLGGAASLDIEWMDDAGLDGTNMTLGYAINDDLGLSIQMGDANAHTWGGGFGVDGNGDANTANEITRFTLSWGDNWSFSNATMGTTGNPTDAEYMSVDYSASF